LDDAIEALKNDDNNRALVHLNLVKQQLVSSSNSSNNIATTPLTPAKGITLSPASSQINKVQANHPPQAYNALFQATTGLPIRFVLSASDSENENITFSIISEPSHGMITNFSRNDGFVTYAPTPGYIGTDSFSFYVLDDHKQSSNVAKVSINVNASPKPSESTTRTTPSEQSTPSQTLEQPPSESPSFTPSQPSQSESNGNIQNNNNDINWESLCNIYGSLVGLKEPCSYYAHGTQLTPAGGQALICLLGGGLLAVINPSVAAAAKELASRSNTICP
jgi:hypothetical protein